MKIVTYRSTDRQSLGILVNDRVYNLHDCDRAIPLEMNAFLRAGESIMERAKAVNEKLKANEINVRPENQYELLAPVPNPTSCRDGYAFRQHVAAARRNRGVPMIPEFDQYPIFYFTNHQSIAGPGDLYCMPDHFQKLDFELEAAIVIGKQG